MKRIFLTLFLCLNFLNAAIAETNVPENQLPKDWVMSPEDQTHANFEAQSLFTDIREKLLSGVLGRIFNANLQVVDSIPEQKPMAWPGSRREPLRDEAPWHLEAFTTELAVYASGLLGALTLKGQPAVQVYWKKQGPKPTPNPMAFKAEQDEEVLTYSLNEDVTDENLVRELEPMVKAALVSGKVKDENEFRGQVHQAAKEFRYLVSGLNTTSNTQWWLSTFRFDLMVGASGKLLPAPVLTTGGDLRLRFDWARMKKSVPTRLNSIAKPSGPYILTNYLDKARQDLQDFMIGMEKDLDYAFAKVPATEGLKAYNFRIALGITVKGNLGAVKGSASAFGHLIFANNISAPKTYPVPKANLLAMEEEVEQLAPLYIIERNTPEKHIQYATANMIPYKIDDNKEAYFKVDRKAFRKGLMRAVKIGQWFAKKGAQAESRKWKMYQLKSSFDLSISGNIEVVSIGGTVAAEMSFYNMNF